MGMASSLLLLKHIKVVKCLIATREAFANKAHQFVFPTKHVIFTIYFNVVLQVMCYICHPCIDLPTFNQKI
jgi:hypothetical protein